ncbi:hypothetical protein [Enterobacter cloacae complex sp. 284J4]|uniref:hypothetical protein n=1 Tax=Enterobacter cloacae complex sp. 284J4 TaxID=3395851 RepID=UPI003CF8D88E
MESLIEHLRTITEWSKQPAGFAGAVLVADKHIEAGKVFKRFISGINDNPHWMNALIKKKNGLNKEKIWERHSQVKDLKMGIHLFHLGQIKQKMEEIKSKRF